MHLHLKYAGMLSIYESLFILVCASVSRQYKSYVYHCFEEGIDIKILILI